MIGTQRCPICDAELRPSLATPRVRVAACGRCGHHVARHGSAARAGLDYHQQYDGGDFVTSLAIIRRLQARVILARIARLTASGDELLDVGAGRGWFLEEAHAGGLHRLAGADTSDDAVRYVREAGAEGLVLEPPSGSEWHPDLRSLSFRPRVVTLLDVIEHFPPERLRSMFAAIVDQLRPELQLVVVKVPVADGFLYRTSRLLARGGLFAPLEQLYQVGTEPPHLSYFSRSSLTELLEGNGLRVVDEIGLVDFDSKTFGARVSALSRAPRVVSRAIGGVALFAERWAHDSWVAFARPITTTDRT